VLVRIWDRSRPQIANYLRNFVRSGHIAGHNPGLEIVTLLGDANYLPSLAVWMSRLWADAVAVGHLRDADAPLGCFLDRGACNDQF
jgi:hypothetical protein